MKKIIISSLIICFGFHMSFGQNTDTLFIKSKFKGNIDEYFVKNLRLSTEQLIHGYKGKSIISFRINEKGVLDSIEALYYSDIEFGRKVTKLVGKTKNMWMPTIQNGDTIAYRYKLIVEDFAYPEETSGKDLSLSCKEDAEKLLKNKQYQSALVAISASISLTPYRAEYYLIRSKCYKLLENPENAEKDYHTYKSLEREIVGEII